MWVRGALFSDFMVVLGNISWAIVFSESIKSSGALFLSVNISSRTLVIRSVMPKRSVRRSMRICVGVSALPSSKSME